MSTQKGNSKRQRTHRISEGVHGATKHPLTTVQKVLADKGLMQSIKHIPLLKNWRGVGVVREPWNAKNVTENKIKYPHLFMED